MSISFPELANLLKTLIPSLELQIVRKDGQNLSGSWSRFSLQGKYHGMILLECGLPEQDSKHLEAELRDPRLWKTSSNLLSTYFGVPLVGVLHPWNVTT